jgi:hypothetical protein
MARKKQTILNVKEFAKVFTNSDDKLAWHLEHAEAHLIEAVKTFELNPRPERHADYVSRLTRAQEMVTVLFREELIRIRGPIKVAARSKKK